MTTLVKPRWRIYYGSGATYSNLDGPAEEAPALDVIAIVQDFDGRSIIHGGRGNPFIGYYWYDGETWCAGDLFGLWDYLAQPGWKRVIFGRTIPGDLFHDIIKAILVDPDFPAVQRS